MEEIVCLSEDDIKSGLEDCSRSLVGRLMADRSFSMGMIEAAFFAIWNQPEGFCLKYHCENIYQFFFAKEADVIRVERGSPWLFKQYVIHVRRWNAEMNIEEADYSLIPTWIQLWGMPDHCKTKEAAHKIGERLGEVLEVETYLMRSKEDWIMKVRINLNVTHTLKQIIRMASPDKKIFEVQLKYERLGIYYSFCGFIGHDSRNCSKLLENSVDLNQKEERWSTQLRAEFTGWKLEDNKENVIQT
ncbi:uncharacterized protein LOC130963326 [Arachis stenosperma]|uniref:uncharacterized protein LOC130963326 n=1 Tax=Arachis stenosperma TaxID=217475 RepID=UPI0025AC34B5|nr:uncharacterized protein LOC130963326 [Arachis stenosperma]